MTALPIIDIESTCPWLAPGQVLKRGKTKGSSNEYMLVLEVDRDSGVRTFVARTCNIQAGTVGPTTIAPVSIEKVGDERHHDYKIVGTLRPQPERGQIIKSLDGEVSFRVLSVSEAERKCVLSEWGAGKLVPGRASEEVNLDASFWARFKVFWPRAPKK